MKFLTDKYKQFRENRIRKLAYQRYQKKGFIHGHDKEDWYVVEKQWVLLWLWSLAAVRVLLKIVILILALSWLYGRPAYKAIDLFVPSNIKESVLKQQIQALYTENIRFDFLLGRIEEIKYECRYPVLKEFLWRIYYKLLYRCFHSKRPFVLADQSFYSYIYYAPTNPNDPNSKLGPNYATVHFICAKNIGEKTAIINDIPIFIDSEMKHGFDQHKVIREPIPLFPNEEVLLCYGQEIPCAKFKVFISLFYSDLEENIYHFPEGHKIEFNYNFNKKIYQFL